MTERHFCAPACDSKEGSLCKSLHTLRLNPKLSTRNATGAQCRCGSLTLFSVAWRKSVVDPAQKFNGL